MFKQTLKHSMILLVGMFGAQIINFISIPIITRLYAPEVYGNYTEYIAVAWIIGTLASLKIEVSIPIAKWIDSIRFKASVIKLSFAISLLSITMVYLLKQDSSWLFVFFPSFFISLSFIETSFLSKLKAYKLISNLRLVQVALQTLMMFVFYYIDGTYFSLLCAFTLSRIPYLFILYNIVKRTSKYGKEGIAKLIEKNSKVVKFTFPSSVCTVLMNQLPILLLASLFNKEYAAFYALIYSVLVLPSSLISGAISNSIYPKLSVKTEKTKNLLFNCYLLLIAISLIVFILVFTFSQNGVFTLLLGSEWGQTSTVINALTIWLSAQFSSTVFSNLFYITGRNAELLFFTVLDMLCRILFLYSLSNPDLAILYLSYSGAIFSVVITIRGVCLYMSEFKMFTLLAFIPPLIMVFLNYV